jgi:hypothetical protein
LLSDDQLYTRVARHLSHTLIDEMQHAIGIDQVFDLRQDSLTLRSPKLGECAVER